MAGHFAERHLAERQFAEQTVCRTDSLPADILSNGQFDERTFFRKDILTNGPLAESRYIF